MMTEQRPLSHVKSELVKMKRELVKTSPSFFNQL